MAPIKRDSLPSGTDEGPQCPKHANEAKRCGNRHWREEQVERRLHHFGILWQLDAGGDGGDDVHSGDSLGPIHLPLPGLHWDLCNSCALTCNTPRVSYL